MQDRIWRLALLVSMLLCLYSSTTSAQSCSNYKFTKNQIFTSCNDLPFLNSFLHWTYTPSSQTVKIAYRHSGVSTSRWVAWAINPTAKGMHGSQALVAYQKSDGTMRAYTSPVDGYNTVLQEGDLSFPVSDLSATYSNNEIIIFATLKLQNLSSNVNQVWQEGPLSGDSPSVHDTTGDSSNLKSMATLNLLSGESTSSGGGVGSSIKKKNIHGVLNAVSWGILMPMGAVVARYLKVFPSADPAWFYLHVACQVSGYIVGVSGWATGLKLGKDSVGIQYTAHRIIGIVIFCLATIQVFALFLRPKKEHKYRFYWNVYHHVFGYSIIVLSIINIFKGFNILNPKKRWERAYIGILIGLASAAIFLEIITWYIVIKRKKSARGDEHKLPSRNTNGTNGLNGAYHGRETERI